MPSSPKPSPVKNTATPRAAKPKAAPAPAAAKAAAPKPAAPKPAAPAAKPVAPPKAVVNKPAEAPPAEPRQTPRPPKAPAHAAPAPIVIRPFSRSLEARAGTAEKQAAKPQKLSAAELRKTRDELVAMRNRLITKTQVMRRVALERYDEINTEEDGIDQFDRLFEIEKIASVQEFVNLIDEALRALDEGVYGACQKCGVPIEKARIQALPFAKACIRCQNEAERMKSRA